nr:MAG TPA: minor tail protein [Caudoviricetes sp.]
MAVDIDSLQIEIEATSSDAAAKIDALATALTNLKTAAKGGAGLTTVSKQMQALANAAKLINSSSINTVKLKEMTSALNGLSSIQKSSGLSSTINALKKLPQISESLEKADLGKFAVQMNQVADAMRPLATEMQKVSSGFSAFPIRIQKIIQSNTGLAASNNKAAKSFGVLGTGISSAQAKFGIYSVVFRQIARTASDWVKESNDYVENLNLFTVAMGDAAESALEYAEAVKEAVGIDPSEWIRNQGVFKQITGGFGVMEEKANLMSKNLTQLGYDISSFYNISIEEAMEKLQSGIAGEIEPLRRLGYAIDVATLQEVAYAHGIEQSVNTMNQAQKSQLRYLAIMEQSGNVMGDMARTVQTPANALRILNQQITQLTRALGNLLIPFLQQIIPYVQAFVEVITDAIQALALLVGFELPEIDYSGLDGVTSGATDAEDAIEGATGAAKEMKKALLGIDELTILEPTASGGGGGSGGGIGGDLGLDLPEYDFLNGLTDQTNELKEAVKDLLYNYVIPAGTAFAAWKVATGLLQSIEKVKAALAGLKGVSLLLNIEFKALGLTMLLADLNEFMRYLNDFRENGATFQNVAGMISEFAGMVGDALIVLGALKVGGALKAVQGIGELIIAIKDISENGINFDNALTTIRGLTNIAIGIGVFTGNIKVAAWGVAIQGFTTIVREISTNWEAIKQGDWSGVDKATLIIGALEVLGGLAVALDAFSKLKSIGNIGKAATAVETVTTATEAVNTSVSGKLSPSLSSLAKNLGLGVAIIAEVSAAAVLVVGAIAVLGYELEQVGIAWEPVIDNGATVAAGVGLGTAAIAAVGLATYGLGTLGATAALNIGIGTAILLELGVAAGLFIVEIWAIGKGLDEIGQAWQPVLDNGETIAAGIGLGTTLLIGIGVVTAALGVATVASVGLLPIAIGLGTAILVELAAAFVLFTESLVSVADELNFNLAPSLRGLNDTLPQLTEDMSDFVDFMSDFAEEISSYTDSMGSITWDSIVSGFQRLFAGNPIQNLASDVENITKDTKNLNSKLELANPEIEKAIDLTSNYISLMESLKLNIDGSSNISLASDMFTNLKEVGKQLVVGFSNGVSENAPLAYNTMKTFGSNVVSNIKAGIENAKPSVRNSLENLFTGVKVKVPHFSITGSFNLERMSVPKISVSTYAIGGFPDHGEMFIAREQGPELVGRIGNRTAVANNDQIVEGVAAGVTSANDGVINAIYAMAQQIISAIEENSGDVYLDGDKVGERVTEYQNRKNRIFGR